MVAEAKLRSPGRAGKRPNAQAVGFSLVPAGSAPATQGATSAGSCRESHLRRQLSHPPHRPPSIYNLTLSCIAIGFPLSFSLTYDRAARHGLRRTTCCTRGHPLLPFEPPGHRRSRGSSETVPDLPLRPCPARIWARREGPGLFHRYISL